MEPVKVRIHDQEYLLKSDGDVEQIEEIADYVNQKLADVQDGTEGLSDRKVAILAALSIAGEYLQARRERDEVKGLIRQRTDALISIIDSAIT
jgi:cell division protein ZapA